MDKNILVIGAPNTGKTHFGGQLYGRLKSNTCTYKLRETPDDLSVFQDILQKLNNGVPGDHTPSSINKELVLPILSKENDEINLVYPDYGGEQITQIVKSRKINSNWQNQINESTDWILFIRLNLVELPSDITNRFYSHISRTEETSPTDLDGITDKSQIFYIELMQILLSANKSQIDKPFLQIFISCWDELTTNEKPEKILNEKMPLFFDFIKNNWGAHYSVIGIAATGISLESDNPNEDFMLDGPEEHGFIIMGDGKKDTDLTLSLKQIINND